MSGLSPSGGGTPSPEQQRRSLRVTMAVPVEVVWTRAGGIRVREDAQTEVVNSHGALLRLNAHLPLGITVELIHRKSRQRTRARVVNLYPPGEDGWWRIGVELDAPSETFWGLSIPGSKGRPA